MKRICILIMLCIIGDFVLAKPVYQDVYVPNVQGVGLRANPSTQTVTSRSTDKAFLRSASMTDCGKLWIQFDLTDIWENYGKEKVVSARFKQWSENGTGRRFSVAGVLDDPTGVTEEWTEAGLDWVTAPANNPASHNTIDLTKVYGGAALWIRDGSADSITIDLGTAQQVPPGLGTNFDQCASYETVDNPLKTMANTNIYNFLMTDTDGKVTLIVWDHYNSNQNWWIGNPPAYDNDPFETPPLLTADGRRVRNSPSLILELPPLGADNPEPYHEDIVKSDLAQLSWTNPASANPVICTVYLGTGTEPNRLAMDSITLAPNATSVAINTTNFPTKGNLKDLTQYWWIVDCDDTPAPDPNIIEGMPWTFFVNNNNPPVVDAGPDQVVWMPDPNGVLVNLDGTVTDDGLPVGASLTYKWTRVSGPATVVITPDTTVDTSVTLTVRGTYVFQLAANDTNMTGLDTVQVIVGNNSCDASHLSTGAPYDQVDVNQDCIVDLLDFYVAIAEDWLVCTDTLTNCID